MLSQEGMLCKQTQDPESGPQNLCAEKNWVWW